jgi:hypothetical protein
LTDGQIVKRLMQICEAEKVKSSDDGIAALVFSAEGDMRQAINNLQSTWAGFGFVSGDNVFRVVDSPHPVKVQAMIKACWEGKVDEALDGLNELWYAVDLRPRLGFCTTGFRGRLTNTCIQGPGILLSRYHQHHVPSHQVHPDALRALEVGVYQGDRFHAYAHSGRGADVAAVERVHSQAMQDQHEAGAFPATGFIA